VQVKLRAEAVREVCQAPQPRVRALWFIPLQLSCVRLRRQIGAVRATQHEAAGSMLSAAHPQRHPFLIDWQRKGSYVLVADIIGALEPDEQLQRELRCWS